MGWAVSTPSSHDRPLLHAKRLLAPRERGREELAHVGRLAVGRLLLLLRQAALEEDIDDVADAALRRDTIR